jgi:hypothetical protein
MTNAFEQLIRESDKATPVPESIAKYAAALVAGTHEITSLTIQPKRQWVGLTDEMVTAAARALNKRQAEACGVDKNDHWKFYGDDIKEDARAALEAAHNIKEKNT